jgi:hypothetical protein
MTDNIRTNFCATCKEQADRIEALHEKLAAAYIALSGTDIHASDCATSNAPAYEPGPFGQPGICSECGMDDPEVDEATELCLSCYEHIMGPETTND